MANVVNLAPARYLYLFSLQTGLPDNLRSDVNICIFLYTSGNIGPETNGRENIVSGNVVMGTNLSSRAASVHSLPSNAFLSLRSFFADLHR